jgi:hypothetical protein
MKQFVRLRNIATILICGLWAMPALASTENEEAAQAAFDEALKLMRVKRYAEACAHLARSQELDPTMVTQFRLADCYEKLGRFASAYDLYVDVAEVAKNEKQIQREAVARSRATAIETKIARLTIDISPSVASLPGLEIHLDGVIVKKNSWAKELNVDVGERVVTVQAPDKTPFERKLSADVGAKLVVSVAALDDKPGAKQGSRSSIPTYVLLGAGGVGVGLGFTFLALRAGRVTEAETLSEKIIAGGGNCRPGGPAAFTTQCASLLDVAKRGDTYGTGSVLSFAIGGAALLGMGAYLLWPQSARVEESQDEHAVRFVPVINANTAGFMASGVF